METWASKVRSVLDSESSPAHSAGLFQREKTAVFFIKTSMNRLPVRSIKYKIRRERFAPRGR